MDQVRLFRSRTDLSPTGSSAVFKPGGHPDLFKIPFKVSRRQAASRPIVTSVKYSLCQRWPIPSGSIQSDCLFNDISRWQAVTCYQWQVAAEMAIRGWKRQNPPGKTDTGKHRQRRPGEKRTVLAGITLAGYRFGKVTMEKR